MSKKDKALKWILTIIMLVVGIGCIVPFIFMISSSFKVSGDVMKFPWSLIPDSPTLQTLKALLQTASTIFRNGI